MPNTRKQWIWVTAAHLGLRIPGQIWACQRAIAASWVCILLLTNLGSIWPSARWIEYRFPSLKSLCGPEKFRKLTSQKSLRGPEKFR